MPGTNCGINRTRLELASRASTELEQVGHLDRFLAVTLKEDRRTRTSMATKLFACEGSSWSDHEGRNRAQQENETRIQDMEARVNIPSGGQSTKDFPPDVIRVWLVLQRSGLSESSKNRTLQHVKHVETIKNCGSFETTVAMSF